MTVTTVSAGVAAERPPRVTAVDVMRGFVMVVMALDHTREFFTNWAGNPLDPQDTTPALYVTRWVTHVCAPVFVFLAGTSIFLQRRRKTERRLTFLLLTRGLWLVVVELTLVQLVFNFNWRWDVQLLEVIWAIGASMMVMAALIHLSARWNLLLGALLILGHNAFDGVTVASLGRLGWLWNLLHVPGLVTGPPTSPPVIVVAYPLLPWVGVMALGYAFGSVLLEEGERRLRIELRAGALMLVAFALLRLSNLYGDPVGWSAQSNWWRTLLSFFNVQKYPPSLLFLLATLGVSALIMAAIEYAEARGALERTRRVLKVYGRVPLFYFLLHIALVHLLALTAAAAAGGDWRWWLTEFPNGGVLAGHPPGYGYGLGVVWCVWVFVLALCYPACRWYAGVKMRSRNPLLSYL
ncbi:MAG TPA: heparan-alpha-glucosaminide N-acetyltransferase domain-containing protein [Pyrinomonadaceae bacterium]|nr:heparan-alpha-glucosaminide N-acetyltransferase domain-containing protein [Pyrinomonadaceae bacterium]